MDDPKIAPKPTHDGFQLRQARVELPFAIDTKTQLESLVCHLFVDEKCSIWTIMRLGIDRPSIIRTLLERGAIRDRRLIPRAA
jgi:hypothetical protein